MSPDVAEQFAAEVLLARLVAGHDAFGGGNDRDAKTAANFVPLVLIPQLIFGGVLERIERLFAWLLRQRRLVTRWEWKAENFLGLLQLACAQLLWRAL